MIYRSNSTPSASKRFAVSTLGSCLVLGAFTLASPAHAGHGFFSPAHGTWHEAKVRESPVGGKLWAAAGGTLYSSMDEGRTWRAASIPGGAPWGSRLLEISGAAGGTIVAASGHNILVSADGGESWTRVERRWGALGQLEVRDGVWIARFEPDQVFGRGELVGVYRSFDLGASWDRLEFAPDYDVFRVKIAAGPGGQPLLIQSTSSLDDFQAYGIFVSQDRGSTFDRASLERFESLELWEVFTPSTFAGPVVAFTRSSNDLYTIYYSHDQGRTFERSELPDEVDQLWGLPNPPLFHPTDPDRMLLQFGLVDSDTGSQWRFFLSTDGGRSWGERADLEMPFTHEYFGSTIDGCDPSVLYSLGRPLSDLELSDQLLRSSDRGRTWTRIEPPTGLPSSISFDVLYPLRESCRLLASTSHGLYSSLDRGRTWQPWGRGLRSGYFDRAVVFDPSSPSRVYAAGFGLARSDDGGRVWNQLDNRLSRVGSLLLAVHSDGTLLAVGNSHVDGLIGDFGGIWRSTDRGQTFVEIPLPGEDPVFSGSASAAVDPGNPDRVIVVDSFGTWETLDFGLSWEHLDPDFDGTRPWRSVVIDPADPDHLWGIANSWLYRSFDGGRSWDLVHRDPPLSSLWAGHEPGELWGIFGPRLYQSTDGGESWVERYEAPFLLQDLDFDTRNPDTLYLTARDHLENLDLPALLRSTDGGDSWHSWGDGLPSRGAYRLAQNPSQPNRWVAGGASGLYWLDEGPRPACPVYRSPGLCLQSDRFEVAIDWSGSEGSRGRAHIVPFQTSSAGLFTIFDPDNWEAMVKVLDGCGINGHYWVFGAASTNLDYTVTVTDSADGRYRQYFNFLGENAPAITDINAFPCASASGGFAPEPARPGLSPSAPRPSESSRPMPLPHGAGHPPGRSVRPAHLAALAPWVPPSSKKEEESGPSCGTPESPALCLGEGGRFRVAVRWSGPEGPPSPGVPVPVSSMDSGLFTFFDATNWELMVKVLDACAINGRFWVLGAASTNLAFEIEITDRSTGENEVYRNAIGQAAEAIIDTEAFDCP